ncbi:MAG TPA: hypothetical protein ENJ80_08925 [Gammaproteobacteria bacterium]|nr:hypothetical protein [Gammaproteobacteria bacterium]
MLCIGLGMGAVVLAQPVAVSVSSCNSPDLPDALAVVEAGNVPELLGKPVRQITLLHYRGRQLLPITSQIDQRDSEGRYLLDDRSEVDDPAPELGPDDEIVFRLGDRGPRRPSLPAGAEQAALVEIEVTDSQTGKTGWIYAGWSGQPVNTPARGPVRYSAATDSVETGMYKIGFSRRHPFLIDDFHWQLAAGDWSPDLLDVMKIRHQGKMFGFIPFRRTEDDYSSRLTRVKTGPLRVIRRTENHVRILWALKTPAVYIDYVMMPDSFVMDTIIDIPFNLGLFFSDIETLTTVDWRKAPALPELTIRSPDTADSLVVNGQMSGPKHHFNTISGTRLSVHSAYGSVYIKLDIPDGVPIQPWLYLDDRFDVADPPEKQPGQFGNVGYRTTGWENIDTDVQHVKFTTCMTAAEPGHGR